VTPGIVLAPLTVEDQLRRRIVELERERDLWQEEAAAYKRFWLAMTERCDGLSAKVRELTAALARIGLRLP